MKSRIAIEDQDGKGCTSAYVMPFHNAIMQRRMIAFDGQRWFVQANNLARFKPVGESEVPADVRKRMLEESFSLRIRAAFAALGLPYFE